MIGSASTSPTSAIAACLSISGFSFERPVPSCPGGGRTDVDTTLTWAFWLAVASLAYMYAGFPLTVAVCGLLRRRMVRKAPVTPTLSLIIAAYNEEASIGARLENALASDYPSDRLQ